jgi:phosphocarrier protein FPr
VTLRLLDVGGDKPLRYVELPAEANPFLGVRGVRVALSQPQLLLPQLRAALRVAAERPLRLLIPMVSRVAEVTQERRLVDEARDGLLAEGKAVPGRIDLGVMVEVPAAALLADALVEHADFLSIGTNDLTQYVMAADRGNVGVAHLNDALEPAVLRLIASVCKAARDAEVSAGVCGAIASDTMAIPLLLALGVQELSVPPPAVAMVKQAVRNTNLAEAVTVAERALACESAAAVRDLIQELPPARPDTDGAVGQTSASTASSGRGTRSRSTDWTSRRA